MGPKYALAETQESEFRPFLQMFRFDMFLAYLCYCWLVVVVVVVFGTVVGLVGCWFGLYLLPNCFIVLKCCSPGCFLALCRRTPSPSFCSSSCTSSLCRSTPSSSYSSSFFCTSSWTTHRMSSISNRCHPVYSFGISGNS